MQVEWYLNDSDVGPDYSSLCTYQCWCNACGDASKPGSYLHSKQRVMTV